MNRIRSLAVAGLLTLALTTVAQQSAPVSADSGNSVTDSNGVPTVDAQLRLFGEKLDLSAEQQTRLKPVLDDLYNATVKIIHDESMSRAERMNNVMSWRMKTDKRIREILNDDQKKKLDQVEQEPHPELHGNVEAAIQAPAQN
jgi:Spy/CpxP family protein refolding chaperone